MAERVAHGTDQFDRTVIAQAEGVLSAREHVDIAVAAETLRGRALARGVSIEQVAREVVASTQPTEGDHD